MKSKIIFYVCCFMILVKSTTAQNVGINTTTPHSSAALDIVSANKGLLVPRLTTTQRNAINTPAQGLLVFDTDDAVFYYYDGSVWQSLSATQISGLTTDKVVRWDGTNLSSGITTDNGTVVGIGTVGTPNSLLTIGQNLSFTGIDATMSINVSSGESLFIGDANTEQGIIIGKNGNELQAKSGTNFTTNESLLLNPLGGNIGINNTNPIAPLSVGASYNNNLTPIAVFNATNNKPILVGETINHKGLIMGYEGNDIQGRSGNSFGDNSDLLLNSFGGNVGIGTNTPAEKLDVNGKTKTTELQLTDGATNGYILKSDANGNATWINPTTITFGESDPKVGTLTNNYVPKWNNTSLVNGMLYDNGIQVGIGTNTPTTTLDINGKVKSTELQLTNGASNGYILMSDASGNASWTNTNTLTLPENDPKVGNLTTGRVPYWNGAALANGRLFDNGFYIGIGTTTPNVLLTVGETFSTSANSISRFNTNGNEPVVIAAPISEKGLMLGYEGNDIQGRTGNNLAINGDLILNQFGGNVGIGTNTPTQAKLVVNGSTAQTLSFGYLRNTGTTGTETSQSGNFSIYADNRIAASEFNAFSDKRIKRVLGLSDNQKDLMDLMKIKITDYQLIDSISKGNKVYKKVIAQEVAEVLPNAITKSTNCIPDIYQLSTLNNGFIVLANHHVKQGERVKIILEDKEQMVLVNRITEDGFFIDNATLASGKVFVYGREVDDFHSVDYEALTTLNISATQALLKQINELESQTKHQQAQLNQLNNRMSSLEKLFSVQRQ